MFSKTNAKHFALGLALALALVAAPQTLAGPTFGGDVGSTLVGFFANVWQSVVSLVGADDDANFGPWVGPNGEPVDEPGFGPVAAPNGVVSGDPQDETGAGVIPNGLDGDESGDEYGPYLIPNG